MELRQLAHFLTVATERHFTRAAEREHLAQSSLSSSIRALERELGTALLVRTTRRVDLTAAGRELLPHARRALAASDDGRAAVDAVRGVLRGRLAVGSIQSGAFLDLPTLIATFRRRHPGITVDVSHDAVSELVASVVDGERDLALVDGPLDGHRVQQRALGTEHLVLAVAPDDPLADRDRVALAELADRDFVEYRRDSALRALIDRFCRDAGLDRHIVCESDTIPSLLDLVAHGAGVSLVPPTPREDLVTVDVEPTVTRDLVLITARGRPLSPATKAFLGLLDEQPGRKVGDEAAGS